MWTYHEPAKLIFGVGAAENLNSELEALGVTKAVLLSSKSMFRQGIPQQLAELTGGKIVAISTEVEPDPTVENVDHAAALARQNGADCVIGLGGGSVIDCAKATAAAVAEDLSAAELVRKKDVKAALPIIASPTTAGTGSEVTRVAVISDKSAGLKLAVYSQALFPNWRLLIRSTPLPSPSGRRQRPDWMRWPMRWMPCPARNPLRSQTPWHKKPAN